MKAQKRISTYAKTDLSNASKWYEKQQFIINISLKRMKFI